MLLTLDRANNASGKKMEPQLMRDLAKCLIHNQDSTDHQALMGIVDRLNGLHPSPEETALVSEGIARAYRIGKADSTQT
jgi:hypothetical protein